MTLTVVSSNRTATLTMGTANDSLVLQQGVVFSSITQPINASADVTGREFFILGSLFAFDGNGLEVGTGFVTPLPKGGQTMIEVGVDGSIHASGKVADDHGRGVWVTGNTNSIVNRGSITGQQEAVLLQASNSSLVNEGTIASLDNVAIREIGNSNHFFNSGRITPGGIHAAVELSGDGTLFENVGSISARQTAFDINTSAFGRLTLVNSGSITGRIDADAGIVSIINSGTITGSINLQGNGATYQGDGGRLLGSLSTSAAKDVVTLHDGGYLSGIVSTGDGADVLDLTGADLSSARSSTIIGGNDSDTYIVDSATWLLTEFGTGGTADLVQSTVSFKLGGFFEKLTLIGDRDNAGRGNGIGNDLNGNHGDNRLFGYGGVDTLNGGAGDDVLVGGVGRDRFEFLTESDRDTITDYVATGANKEKIVLDEPDNFTTFADFKADRMRQSGANVVIDMGGGDVLVLQGEQLADFTATNFQFL